MVLKVRRKNIVWIVLWIDGEHVFSFLVLLVFTFLWAVDLRPNIGVNAGEEVGTRADCVAIFGVE